MAKDYKELLNAVEAAESLAQQASVSEERKQALDYYLGKPLGNEQPGRSQVISKDCADTIGWILPSLMKVFCGGDDVVMFTPRGPEDIKPSEQESDYINFVITQRNQHFIIFHDWFLDALLQKVGYCRAAWVETVEAPLESYRGLTDEELAMLLQSDPEIEIVGHETVIEPTGLQVHNVDLRSKKIKGYVKIECLPPEQVLVGHNHREVSLANASFVEHWEWKTISELRDEGFDVSDDIQDESQVVNSYWEAQNRNEFWNDQERDIENDPSMRRVKAREIWLRYDQDGDGVAELLHLVVVGHEVLEEEEVDFIPIAALCPKPLPHQHYGQSIADDTMDIQEIKTFLIRGHIDNVALANYGRYGVNADRVNIDDMLTSRPGGLVRVQGDPAGAILPFNHPDMGASILQSVEYIDQVRENRTGTNRYFTGVDANSLNKTASGISQLMNASQARVEMYARIFAETGIKELFRIVHGLTLRHQRKPEIVRLRNEWVPVDPRTWSDRYDMQVTVGLGTGNKDSQLMHLQTILMAQKEALPLGITTPKNIYNALAKLTQNAGFKAVEEFWTDPEQNPQQPQPDPEMLKNQAEMQQKQAEMQMDAQTESMKLQHDAQIEQMKMAQEMRIEEMNREFEAWKAKLEADTRIAVEEIKATNQMKSLALKTASMNQQQAPDDEGLIEHKPTTALTELVNAINENMQYLIGAQQQSHQEMVKHLTKPKNLIRDPQTNRIIGVE